MKTIKVICIRGEGTKPVEVVDPLAQRENVLLHIGKTILDDDHKSRIGLSLTVPIDRYYEPGEVVKTISGKHGVKKGRLLSAVQKYTKSGDDVVATYSLTIETLKKIK